ncbi:MAG: ABC transporter substrate-binding protein, partial [Oscillospiraceae bacterium]|nr:ABC transporter substrate-binding protein [Oscillospiraceae bacterium]
MRKLTKSIALLLAVLMIAGVFVACGGGGSTSGGQSGLDVDPATLQFPLAEKAEISGLTNYPVGSEAEPNNRTIFKRLEEKTNVHVNWKAIQSDQWGDKISLEMSNLKTLPEFVFSAGFSDTDLLKYA